MNVRGHRAAASLLFLMLSAGVRPLFSQQQFDPLEAFNANGFDQNRNYFSGLPIEHIDPMTGNLILTFTDLVLPGNAGFDLRIQRVYNSKIYRNFNSLGDLLDEDSWAGVGWSMHLGRILNPDIAPVVEMSDGSRHPTYSHIDGSGRFITKDYWVYNRNLTVPTLSLTNGVVYKFGAVINGMRHVTEITDPFANKIVVTYANPSVGEPADGIKKITQYLSSTKTRVVNFTYETSVDRKNLKTISYTGEKTYTWTYVHTTVPVQGPLHSLLKEVKPPVGPSWLYQYNESTSPRYELTRATAPGGGYTSYSYSTVAFYNPGSVQIVNSRAVTGKSTGGYDTAADSWSFSYAEGSNKDRSTFTTPCGIIKYQFLGIGNQTFQVEAWQVGLQASKEIRSGTLLLEREDFSWKKGAAISTDAFFTGLRVDADTWVPLLEVRTVTRGSGTFTTTNSYATSNFNDFGRPNHVVESGDRSRTTDYTFDYNFSSSLYLKDRIATETITGGKTLQKSYDYNNTTGFKESETIFGVTTTLSSDAFGNVDKVTDATNRSTDFTYDWGVLKNTITPAYTITRTVVASGLVTSVLRRGFTTSFSYDTLFRVTLIDPPLGANFAYSYDNSQGRWMQLTRGTATLRTDLDGFGRPSATSNAVGVKTDMDYDACGRMTYQSFPYEATANVGTTYEYDPLGRVTRRVYPDGADVLFDYTGLDVEITNERGFPSTQQWEAFGDLSSALLTGVVDEDNQTWSYDYDVMGNLTLVNPPGTSTPNRTWTYNTKNQLTSESHPESGSVSYTYYANGKLQTRTDQAFGQATYSYDNNNRLTYIDWPGTAFTDLDYDASDNRTLLENEAIRSTFTYDGANRLDVRSDLHKSGAFTFSVDYDYDTRDNLQYVTYPRESGTRLKIQYTYDNANRITRVAQVGGAATVYAQSFQYHASGGVKQYAAGNGYTHQFQYDPDRYRVTDISDTGGPQVVLDLQYGYDAAGNVSSIADARPGMSQSYLYDTLDRLEHGSGGWGSADYVYDAQGNRTTQTVGGGSTTYTYSGTTNRLTSATGAEPDSFTYDTNGNLKTTSTGAFTYSPENLVITSTVSGVAASYGYDGDNLRTLKASGGRTVHFFHGPGGLLLSEFESSGAVVRAPLRDYIYAGSRLIASVKYAGAGMASLLEIPDETEVPSEKGGR